MSRRSITLIPIRCSRRPCSRNDSRTGSRSSPSPAPRFPATDLPGFSQVVRKRLHRDYDTSEARRRNSAVRAAFNSGASRSPPNPSTRTRAPATAVTSPRLTRCRANSWTALVTSLVGKVSCVLKRAPATFSVTSRALVRPPSGFTNSWSSRFPSATEYPIGLRGRKHGGQPRAPPGNGRPESPPKSESRSWRSSRYSHPPKPPRRTWYRRPQV